MCQVSAVLEFFRMSAVIYIQRLILRIVLFFVNCTNAYGLSLTMTAVVLADMVIIASSYM